MNTWSVTIGLIIVIICLLPFLLMARSQKKIRARIELVFRRCKGFDCGIREVHYKKLYALAKNNEIFIYADIGQDHVRSFNVLLREVTSIRIEEQDEAGREKISLIFSHQAKPDTQIILYDPVLDSMGMAYWDQNMRIAKNWMKLLAKHINL